MKKVLFIIIAGIVTIASCSKKSAPTTTAAADGATIFAKNCARCHGEAGIKDSRTPNLQTIPLSREGLIHSITYGKDKMPSFQDKLSAAEIAAVADLIVSWHK